MEREYPERLIRGITSPDYIDDEGRLSAQAFQFDDNNRSDNYLESSINWYDDQQALSHVMNQFKAGTAVYQFKAGAAILNRIWLDELIGRPNIIGALRYERHELVDNEYHGNILRKKGLRKDICTMVSSVLAMSVIDILRR